MFYTIKDHTFVICAHKESKYLKVYRVIKKTDRKDEYYHGNIHR